ncbi:MAG: hypothetical protein HY370_03410 [Proteobacteria bacterium]|nr:hypothetical protein [Pseudomonadota bacterium]
MTRQSELSGPFAQMAHIPPGGRTQDVVRLYNRIGDTVMTALKTLAAHSHIGIMMNGKNSRGDPELLDLKRFLRIMHALLPSFRKIEDGDFAYDDPKEDVTESRLYIRMLKNKEIPGLMKKYSDFPNVCAALETISELLLHIDRWKQAVREYVPASRLAEVWREFLDLTRDNGMDAIIPHSRVLDDEKDRRIRICMELSAETLMESDDFVCFLPSEPSL